MKRNIKLLTVFAIVIPMALQAFVAGAQGYDENIHLFSDRPDGQYAKGEVIAVNMKVGTSIVGETLTLRIFENAAQISEEEIVAQDGVVKKLSYDKPVCVIVKVSRKDNPKSGSAIGFMVDGEEFRPGFDCPKDFRKFWDKQLAMMRKVPIRPEVKASDSPDIPQGWEGYEVRVNMHEGPDLTATVVKPENAEPKSLPIILYLHGAGVNKTSNRSTFKTAYSFANFKRSGAKSIAMDLNAHGMKIDAPQSYYDSLAIGPLYQYSSREVTSHGDFYFRLMFLRAVRALDYLTQDPAWNGKILLYGSSQGGAQSAAVAGLDPRVGAAVLIVPAMNDMGGELQGHGNSWCIKGMSLSDVHKKILPYYDGANFLRFFEGRLFMETGLIDETCPSANVRSAFNVAASKDKEFHTFPYRPHNKPKGRYLNEWKEQVEPLANQFIIDYLK